MRDNPLARRERLPLSAVLLENARGAPSWRGPYLDRVPIDPWGRAWVVSFDPSRTREPVVIVSAGPDGVLNTTPTEAAITGDDVGIVVLP